MRLTGVRVFNCFGFGDTEVDLSPEFVCVLGRNSSGKSALLDAISSLAADRVPQEHRRFENFRPTDSNPRIRATLATTALPQSLDVIATITAQIAIRGLPASVVAQHFREPFEQITASYTSFLSTLAAERVLTLTKFPDGKCQLSAAEHFDASNERRTALDGILKRLAPGGVITTATMRYENVNINMTAGDLDRVAASLLLPPVAYFSERYSLTDDVLDYLTIRTVESPPNDVTRALIEVLDEKDLTELLTSRDPDDQDRLRQAIQGRADDLASRISEDANRLVRITISPTSSGLQVTLRTDGKKSFYRHLSDATKFLIAYHIHARRHKPGAILLFDEPSRGLHASAERYLLQFLERLAADNHVIISTHSERLIDLDHLDRIRLMQQDDDDRPVVLNKLRPPRDRSSYVLALQPVFDAIGLVTFSPILVHV